LSHSFPQTFGPVTSFARLVILVFDLRGTVILRPP
jgi:hypothetical protein